MAITVRSGDTLSAIAQRNKVSLAELLRANPQIENPTLIHPGDELHLPGWDGSSGVDAAAVAPKVQLGAGSYTVQAGESLSAIGARFGVSYQALAAANGIDDPNRIYAGQVLQLPEGC